MKIKNTRFLDLEYLKVFKGDRFALWNRNMMIQEWI